MPDTITQRITQIRQTLPPTVRLIAVTKQVAIAAMREAYAAGIRDFGENRVQEAEMKQAQLQDLPDITWHLIGSLQRNKVRKALPLFQWIHSVDNLALAQRINALAPELDCCPNLCLQVKLRPDPNKQGWSIPELLQQLPELDRCTHLQIKGLMTIAPLGLNRDELRQLFQETRELGDKIQQQSWSRLQMVELSMGMSDDYPIAIEAGATLIRLGRIIFGDRRQTLLPETKDVDKIDSL